MIILILSGAVDNNNIKQQSSSNIDKSQVSDKNLQQPGSISNAINSTFAENLLNSYTNYEEKTYIKFCKARLNIIYDNEICSKKQLLSPSLWLNSLVRVNNKPIHYKACCSLGIYDIGYLMESETRFLSFLNLKNAMALRLTFFLSAVE